MLADVLVANPHDELMALKSGLFSFDRQHHQRRERGGGNQTECSFVFPVNQKAVYVNLEHHKGLDLSINSNGLISVLCTVGVCFTISCRCGAAGPSSQGWSFLVSQGLPLAMQELRAPGGAFKTSTDLCVEADENALKVNGPMGLGSGSLFIQ